MEPRKLEFLHSQYPEIDLGKLSEVDTAQFIISIQIARAEAEKNNAIDIEKAVMATLALKYNVSLEHLTILKQINPLFKDLWTCRPNTIIHHDGYRNKPLTNFIHIRRALAGRDLELASAGSVELNHAFINKARKTLLEKPTVQLKNNKNFMPNRDFFANLKRPVPMPNSRPAYRDDPVCKKASKKPQQTSINDAQNEALLAVSTPIVNPVIPVIDASTNNDSVENELKRMFGETLLPNDEWAANDQKVNDSAQQKDVLSDEWDNIIDLPEDALINLSKLEVLPEEPPAKKRR